MNERDLRIKQKHEEVTFTLFSGLFVYMGEKAYLFLEYGLRSSVRPTK